MADDESRSSLRRSLSTMLILIMAACLWAGATYGPAPVSASADPTEATKPSASSTSSTVAVVPTSARARIEAPAPRQATASAPAQEGAFFTATPNSVETSNGPASPRRASRTSVPSTRSGIRQVSATYDSRLPSSVQPDSPVPLRRPVTEFRASSVGLSGSGKWNGHDALQPPNTVSARQTAMSSDQQEKDPLPIHVYPPKFADSNSESPDGDVGQQHPVGSVGGHSLIFSDQPKSAVVTGNNTALETRSEETPTTVDRRAGHDAVQSWTGDRVPSAAASSRAVPAEAPKEVRSTGQTSPGYSWPFAQEGLSADDSQLRNSSGHLYVPAESEEVQTEMKDIDILTVPAVEADTPRNQRTDHGKLWWETQLPQSILEDRQPYSITLQQALGLALTEAPELQVLHSDWYIQQTEVDRLDAAYDWTTFVDAIWNRDSTPVGSQLEGATNRLRTRTLNSSLGVRRLTRSGAQVQVSQAFGLRSSNSQFISPNNQGNSRLALDYELPLMRGAGEDYNTSNLRLAEIQKDAAFDRFEAGVQDHLLEVTSAYWTLVLRRGRYLQAANSWQRAQEIADEMQKRIEVDVTPSMLERTGSEVANRLATTIESRHDIIQAQDALLRLIYGARFTDFANYEIVTLTLPMRQSDSVQPEPQIERALHERSEIHEAIRDIKSASVRFDVAANEIMPLLNMVLTSYVAGLRGNNDIGGSFVNQFNQGEPSVGIGFNFEIPYRNRAAQAAAEQSHIAIKRMQAQFEATVGLVTEDVRNQVIQRNKHGEVLTQQLEALERADRILAYTKKRREVLADGADVADLYLENLLQMQERLAFAEYNYLQSQIRYSLADNALLRAVAALDTLAAPPAAVEMSAPVQEFTYTGGHALSPEIDSHPESATPVLPPYTEPFRN